MHGRGLLLALALSLSAACAHVRPSCPAILRSIEQPVAATTAAPVCPAPRDYPWTNLVLEGGGVKGIAYAGAFAVLERQGILPKIERVAGTSAGSIQAALLALGYRPEEIRALLFTLDFKKFEDGRATGLFRFFRRFGWFKGEYFLELMRCLVGKKTGLPRATFADLRRLGLRDLHVFSTDLSSGEARELSAETTPDFEVALAVRMSGSFPLFFAAVHEAGDVFVDGGVLRNYPVDAFDTPEGLDPATLGFVLKNTSAGPPRRPVGGITEYAEALIETLLAVQVRALATDPPNLERTVILNDLGISTLDFELTDRQKLDLIAQGEQCTCDYLAAWQRWQDEQRRPGSRTLAPGASIPIVRRGRCGAAFD